MLQGFRVAGSGENKAIDLSEIGGYVKDPALLLYFVENVKLEKRFSIIDRSLEKYAHELEIAYPKLKYKAIRPLKILCLRMIEEGMGINSFHVTFLHFVVQSLMWA